VTGGIYRLEGTARAADEVLSWSLVLKIARNPAAVAGRWNDDPHESSDWKREALLYRSGILDNLPPGIVAPRCYGVSEPTTDTAWIWQEDVVETGDARWSTERYALAARHLGAFNGAYLVDHLLPTDTCLSRGWRRSAVASVAPLYRHLAVARAHPLVRHSWSDDLLDRAVHLFADQDLFLSALDRLPLTFCHLDAYRRNLLARSRDGKDETVALDWAFSGLGALGEDLAALVAASAVWFQAEPENLPELDRQVFEGYLEGLRDAGWVGDWRLPRLGYTAAAAIWNGIWPYWAAAVIPDLATAIERSFGQRLPEILDRCARVVDFLGDRADEARALMGLVGAVGAA
jgi:hypothetical protein